MLKPTAQCTGRVKFWGITPSGTKVSGFFARIKNKSLQIKVADEWRVVDKIYLSKIVRRQDR